MATNPHTLIDVHPQFQVNIDFDDVKRAGVKGVYIKATEGIDFMAEGFRSFQVRARQCELRTGFYHFLRPHPHRDGSREAEFFYRTVKGLRGGDNHNQLMRLVLDVEENDHNMPAEEVRYYTRAFVARLKVLADHEPILYTYPYFLERWGTELGKLPLWIAHYGVRRPKIPPPFENWVLWQYTKTGSIPGYSGDLDKNKCPRLRSLILRRNEY